MSTSSSSQTLRPILPAPSLQPVVGPSNPPLQPVGRPPGTFRPILPAPARPPEVGQIAYPGLASQACLPPTIAPRTQALDPASLHMIDPALRSSQYTGGSHVLATSPSAPSQGEDGSQTSSQAQSNVIDPTSSGDRPQPSKPRPRPRRRRVVEPSPAPAEASPRPTTLPGDNQAPDAEAAAPAASRKGKGKATEPMQEAGGHEDATASQVQKPTKRNRSATTDKAPSKKRTTKKRTASGAGNQAVSQGRVRRQDTKRLISCAMHRA